MTKFGYTVEYKIETMARAYGRELPLAWKKSVELARQLRGKTVDQAREYLEKVIALKQPVPMRKYNRWVAHKSGIGPARYPVKAAKALLKEYLMNETRRAGFGGLDIQRTPMGTRVTLLAERPGLVIGRKGGAIKALTEAVEQRFRFDNPQIEVQEVASPALNAQIMAEKLANALERGWHFRRAGHSTVRRIMEAGAKGCLVVIAPPFRPMTSPG